MANTGDWSLIQGNQLIRRMGQEEILRDRLVVTCLTYFTQSPCGQVNCFMVSVVRPLARSVLQLQYWLCEDNPLSQYLDIPKVFTNVHKFLWSEDAGLLIEIPPLRTQNTSQKPFLNLLPNDYEQIFNPILN